MNDIRDGHYTLGKAYLNAEQYDEAIEQLEKTVSVDAGFIEAHHALALAYFGQHRLQDAKDAALEALKIDATYQPTLTFLQAIEPDTSTPPPVSAVPSEQPDSVVTPAVEKIETPKPVDPSTSITTPVEKENAPLTADNTNWTDIDKDLERGIVFLANKQYPQAEATFKKVIKASPNHAIAHYNLAQTYMEIGALIDAKVEIDKVLRLNPQYQPAHQLKDAIAYLMNRDKQQQKKKKQLRILIPIIALIIVGFLAFKYNGLSWLIPEKPPPSLSIETLLEDPMNDNGHIDAGESVRLKLTIFNEGSSVKNLKVRMSPPTIIGLRYEIPDKTLKIQKNGFQTMRIPITADKKARTKKVPVKIEVLDKRQNPLTTTNLHLSIRSK